LKLNNHYIVFIIDYVKISISGLVITRGNDHKNLIELRFSKIFNFRNEFHSIDSSLILDRVA